MDQEVHAVTTLPRVDESHENRVIARFLYDRYGYWPQGVFVPLVDQLIGFRSPHDEYCLN